MKTHNVIQNHSDHTLLAISNSKNKKSYLHYKLKILLFGCKSFRLLKLNILGYMEGVHSISVRPQVSRLKLGDTEPWDFIKEQIKPVFILTHLYYGNASAFNYNHTH